jgi:poly(A) polymerase
MEEPTPEVQWPPPQIIPRPEHQLSRKHIEVEALKVLYRLYHAGYKAYLVGGGVRDLLLGKRPKDFDVVTDARPGELRKLFKNSRVIGKRFRLVQVFFRGGHIVEVSTFRCRSEFDANSAESLPKDNTFGTPVEDAHRRDLTINALFYNIADFSLVDYVGGLEDLKARLIRVIGPPALRFTRDPVRMLRVLRHAARINFTIEDEAWEEIKAKRQLIQVCPASRLRDELMKDFKSGSARPFFDLMFSSGLFYAIFPCWEKVLGDKGEKRLLDLFGRVDALVQAERFISDSLLWALFLTSYVEGLIRPETLKELREFIKVTAPLAFAGIEFPRNWAEDICHTLAVEMAIAPLLNENRPVPARLARLAAFDQARVLYRLKYAPAEELPEIFTREPAPSPEAGPKPKRRRRFRPHRRRRRGGKPAGEGEAT